MTDETATAARDLARLRRLERTLAAVAAVPALGAMVSITAFPVVFWCSSGLLVVVTTGVAITDHAIIKRGGDSLWQGGRFVWRDKGE